MLAGRYELDQEIGRGAMGAVWRGHDTLLNRVVAIKRLGLTGGDAPDLARAQREAHLAASVTHHNIVSVFDLVEHDGHQWLVMELVDGPTLRDRIAADGPLDPDDLDPILRQVASALASAHAHGIVHRDVKPSNILLTSEGIAKLSDFGIARGRTDLTLTQTGVVTGSPAYLAPEVATGRPATAASDVWSLGATAFYALEGRQPYANDGNLLGTMYRIVHEEPPRPSQDGVIARLVESMMQRDPAARPTMAEIEASLLTADVDPTATMQVPHVVPAPSISPAPGSQTVPARGQEPPDRRWLLGAAAAVAAVLIAFVAYTVMSGRDDPDADTPRAAATISPTTEPSATEPTPDGATSAGALEGFVADYLTTASNDPKAAYALLTPQFQRASGGYAGYKGFWGRVDSLDVKDVQADPAAMTVAYRYSYDLDGERRTDDVVLQLEKAGDGFLIAGEA